MLLRRGLTGRVVFVARLGDVGMRPADVVNLGFVINVSESLAERIEALQGAYSLTQGVLSLSAMLWSTGAAKGRPYGDGYLTSRNTFQKYFNQGELQIFIESVLDEQAIPVGHPGVFFVFKDRYLEQQFLSGRQSDPSRAPRLLAARAALPRALRATRPVKTKPEEDPARQAEAQAIWQYALQLGRLPEEDEYPGFSQATQVFGSWSQEPQPLAQLKSDRFCEINRQEDNEAILRCRIDDAYDTADGGLRFAPGD